jgi:hypothetical protein
MAKATSIFKFFLTILIIQLFFSCAPAKKNTYSQKRKNDSHVTAERMGRNKYFFSPNYQKKLTHSYKKRK